MPASVIEAIDVTPLNAAMREPFEIATGAKTEVKNVLVVLRLANGVIGYGEAAPLSAFNRENQPETLKSLLKARKHLIGRDIKSLRPLLETIDGALGAGRGAARAALGMAAADAWARNARMPLRLLFGGTQSRVVSDVTVTLLPAPQARLAARRIIKLGVRTIKIKVGRDIGEDIERVRAVNSVWRHLRLILDANQGYGPRQSLALLKGLRRVGISPVLFEQPARREDWRGLKDVHRFGKITVAADESVSNRGDALKMACLKSAQVINIKLMKCGLLEAWDIALITRAAGLGLMVGGMVESSLAMTCSAHFAAGLGGFDFIDLDTPLWFKSNPMRGANFPYGGIYDLSRVKAGIGVSPKNAALLTKIGGADIIN